jgi:putative hydrolase of HD superfamily
MEFLMQDRLDQILNFLEAIDAFKGIQRATYLSDHSRHECDTDHTWHMAMFAFLLHKELAMEVDIHKVLVLILIHDLCEIHAGDTFAFTPEHNDRAAEQAAAQRLFSLLPDDLFEDLLGYWLEFTFGQTREARLARALDRLQGLAQNVFSAGRTWKERGIKEPMSRELNREAIELDAMLTDLFERLYRRAASEDLWSP